MLVSVLGAKGPFTVPSYISELMFIEEKEIIISNWELQVKKPIHCEALRRVGEEAKKNLPKGILERLLELAHKREFEKCRSWVDC